RKFIRRLISCVMVVAYCQTALYWTYNTTQFWLQDKSLRNFIYMIYQPFFGQFANFTVIYIPFYIAMTINYTRIKQKFLLDEIAAISKINMRRYPNSHAILHKFCDINKEILD